MSAAIYTCITADYDTLREPQVVTTGVDYICFSEASVESRTWQVRPLMYHGATPRRTARYHKLMSHLVLAEYDTTLWLDAAFRIDGDLRELLTTWLSHSELALRRHPSRIPSCIYAEAQACLYLKRGEPAAIQAQVREYRQQKYPEWNGVYVTGILARRHTLAVSAFNEEWWSEVCRFSDRDQISFPVVARRRGLAFQPIDPPDRTHDHKPVLSWMKHQRRI